MIGNGFDLRCGLRTRYSDIYNEYCHTPSDNDTLKRFKADILGNYDTWSDFEMALPKFGLDTGNCEDFKMCVQDFTIFLNSYLLEEEKKFKVTKATANAAEIFKSSIYQIYNYCSYQSNQCLQGILKQRKHEYTYQFITFNYTKTLEKCLDKISRELGKRQIGHVVYIDKWTNPLHIHSVLGEKILLGLDNPEQYLCLPFFEHEHLKKFLDKNYINTRGYTRKDDALRLITNSSVVVILGWSMGDSDKTWVDKLRDWFEEDAAHHIIYVPYFKEESNPVLSGEDFILEDDTKNDFIQNKLKIDATQGNRVHIIMNRSFMDLSFVPIPPAPTPALV